LVETEVAAAIEKKKHPVAQASIVAHSHPEPTPKGGKALPQEGKLTNHLIINAEAHGGLPPAGTAHMATLTLCCQSEPSSVGEENGGRKEGATLHPSNTRTSTLSGSGLGPDSDSGKKRRHFGQQLIQSITPDRAQRCLTHLATKISSYLVCGGIQT
ncbi:hypothetical protein KUCAC02_030867, partial [Chaenocephalus aceratus]